PGVAAVGRLEQAAAGAAARHLILDAIRLPHCREQDVRIPAIDLDVHGARLAVAEQLPLPRLPAVGALVEAALVARRAVASEVGDEDDVGVRRMDANLRDRVGVGEAGMGPRLAGVGRLVDAVARHDVTADARLARADEDDVGLRFRDGDGADRRAPDLAVGHGAQPPRKERSLALRIPRPRDTLQTVPGKGHSSSERWVIDQSFRAFRVFRVFRGVESRTERHSASGNGLKTLCCRMPAGAGLQAASFPRGVLTSGASTGLRMSSAMQETPKRLKRLVREWSAIA